MRVVPFKIQGTISGNTVPKITLNYDSTPKVRKFLGFKKHTLKVNLAPQQDPETKGYLLKIIPLDHSGDLIKLKNKELLTTPLNVGMNQTLEIQYTFSRKAKKQSVKLGLEIYSHDQKIIEEKLELLPH